MTKKERRELCLVLISFLFGSIITLLLVKVSATKNSISIYEKNSLAPTIEKVQDSVVSINGFAGGTQISTGAGFVYKTDHKYGYILTNEHVISKESIKVDTTSTKEIIPEIVGKDAYLDIAIIRIDKKYVKDTVSFGKSTATKIGDLVFAIGSPLGSDFQGSVTSGILSGKDRLVVTKASNSLENDCIIKALQTDAHFNPGNSGGPLFNINGEVIGISTMKYTIDGIEGMSFAIPIEEALKYLEVLESGKEIIRPVLGISIADVDNGVKITALKEDSILSNKLQVDDVILKVNDTSIRDTAYFKYEIYQYKIGEKITITYLRDGKEDKVSVTLKG